MSPIRIIIAAMVLALPAAPAAAQVTELKATDVEALFFSSDPLLYRNKQAAYHIVRDLIEAGHWNQADRWMTERYIQHNPSIASGRQAIIDFFLKELKQVPRRISAKPVSPIIAVIAEGDFVTVAFVRELQDPKDPTKTYTTTAFDMWRFVDGKADEHWDSATR